MHCQETFFNQQGLSVHIKCKHLSTKVSADSSSENCKENVQTVDAVNDLDKNVPTSSNSETPVIDLSSANDTQ